MEHFTSNSTLNHSQDEFFLISTDFIQYSQENSEAEAEDCSKLYTKIFWYG